MSEEYSVFKPADVAEVIKPFLGKLKTRDKGSSIHFSVWSEANSRFSLWIKVCKEESGLSIYIEDAHSNWQRVRSLEELKSALIASTPDPIDDLRHLLGIKEQE